MPAPHVLRGPRGLMPGRLVPAAARAALLVLLFAPAIYLAALSVIHDSRLTLALHREALDPRFLPILVRSAGIAAGAVGVALALGGAAAALFESRAFPFRRAIGIASLAPLLFPPVLQVAVWERLASPGGVLASLLPWVAPAGRPFPIRNALFASFLLGLGYSPIVFFFVSRALRGISADLVEAARIARGSWAVAWRVIAPLCGPSIVVGGAIVFTLSFLNYEVPRLLDVVTYPVLVSVSYGALDDPGRAFAVALPGLLLAAAPLLLGALGSARRGFALTGRESPEASGAGRRPGPLGWIALGGWLGLTLVLPIVLLLRLAGSFRIYRLALATDGEKVLWGMAIPLVAAVLAAASAALIVLPSRPGGRLAAMLWIPFAIPGSLLGFALARLLNRGILFEVYDSPIALVLAGWARFLPIACFALAARRMAVPEEEWEAASLGATWRARWIGVRLPLLEPGLTTGAVAVVLLAASELPATLLLAEPGREPLLVRIYNLLHYDPERDILAALSLLHVASILAVVAMLLLAGRILRGGWRKR